MTTVNSILVALTIICGLAALLFAIRGLVIRSSQSRHPYDVARQETRREMQVQFMRAGFLLFLTLILLGIYGLATGDDIVLTGATETPPGAETGTPAGASATATSGPAQMATATIQPTSVVLTATVTTTPTATAAPTQTPAPESAVVNSPNGLWLREAPGGTQQLELIAHETVLDVLPGREMSGDVDWQQVRTPAGNEGWVAAEFLDYQR